MPRVRNSVSQPNDSAVTFTRQRGYKPPSLWERARRRLRSGTIDETDEGGNVVSYKVGTVLRRKVEQADDFDRVRVTGKSPIKDENDADWVGSSNSLLVTPHETFGDNIPLSVARANKEYIIEFAPEEGLEVNQSEKTIGEQLSPEEQFAVERAEVTAPVAPPAEPPKPPQAPPAAAPEPEDE